MAQSAPAASALARSPEYLMPPSAMTGMPALRHSSTQSMIAVNCGTPTPETMRVVQIEPGPMPTLTASAPAATVLHQLAGGLRASMGYVGARTLAEFHARAEFIHISAAGMRESHVHDVTITRESPNYPSRV